MPGRVARVERDGMQTREGRDARVILFDVGDGDEVQCGRLRLHIGGMGLGCGSKFECN